MSGLNLFKGGDMGTGLCYMPNADKKEFSYEEQIERITTRMAERVMISYVQKVIDAHLRVDVDPLALNKWCRNIKREYPNRTPIEVIEILEAKKPMVVDKEFKTTVNRIVTEGMNGAFLNFNE
jgi:hypothetical protein